MFETFSSLKSLRPSKLDWQIKVRVIRVMKNLSDGQFGKINSIDLIILDAENNKMQATIPHHLLRRFDHIISENEIYVIYYFRVIRNSHNSMFSQNNHRILFCYKTEIVHSDSSIIDHYGLSLISANQIVNRNHGSNCLADSIGVLTTFQFDYDRVDSAGFIPVVRFEVADLSDSFPCVLGGKYVDEFREMLSKSSNHHPIILLQFAKLSTHRGFACLENYKEITRVVYNPLIPPVLNFNTRLSNAGGIHSLIHKNEVKSLIVSDITLFDHLYPHKSVIELIETLESGFFVVFAKVDGLIEVEGCWYPVCHCGQFLDICDTSYYCSSCHIYMFTVYPKFKLQVAMSDATSKLMVQISENTLQGIHAWNQKSMGPYYPISHYPFKAFQGKEVLLIVNKSVRSDNRFEDYVEVINATDEEGAVSKFKELGKDFTPIKSVCGPPFAQFHVEAEEDELLSSVNQFINKGKSVLEETSPETQLICYEFGSSSNSRSSIKAANHLSTIDDLICLGPSSVNLSELD